MGSDGRILVVDADPAPAEAGTAGLGHRHEVPCVGTGSDAIAAICETAFDLILLDHRLPDLLGADLLRLIKRFFPRTTVVLMTGRGSEDVAIEALRGGARDYLRKPFHLQELRARIDSLCAARRQGWERRRTAYSELADDWPVNGPPDPDSDRSCSILRAVRHVELHLAMPLTLNVVARLAGMSRFHFCRQFKQTTGLSFRAFLLHKRIARAKQPLRDGTGPSEASRTRWDSGI